MTIKVMKKSIVILWDVSNLCQSYQLSYLSENEYFVIRIYIYIYVCVCVCVCVCVLIVNIKFGDFVRNERNSVWKGLIILFW